MVARSPLLPFVALLCLVPPSAVAATRQPVLGQIDLPHPYYYREMYLPQLTGVPSSVDWSPDAQWLVYSMAGSLFRQRVADGREGQLAEQLTAGPGYDYQPDWSPCGGQIVFVRYDGAAIELWLLELERGETVRLTDGGAVNVEPRFSPDGRQLAWVSTEGTGHFRIHVATLEGTTLVGRRPLRPERRSAIERYYYSSWDHQLSPTWLPDGRELLFVANPEVPYGTGGLWRATVAGEEEPIRVHDEETTWKARPDVAPDGRRVVYSSYLGRQWHQLWVTTTEPGGAPFPVTYGEFDATAARFSPDGTQLAYVSNEGGGTGLWIQQWVGGARRRVEPLERIDRVPMGELRLEIVDSRGGSLPARVSVLGADGRSHAPAGALIHADDAFDPSLARFETHYFHSAGRDTVRVPAGETRVTVWHGLERRVATATATVAAGAAEMLRVELEPMLMPVGWERWQSGDVHVHMNYGGAYRLTPSGVVRQAQAEDLDVVFDLIVNKEQRIPDIAYFSTAPDDASTADVLLLHAQEYHTSFWGHLGLLGLEEHYLLPDYVAYPHTAAASPYPTNGVVADLTHDQRGLVGYVHPFDTEPDPAGPLSHALPIDVALGKVDYYEVVGFSDHRTSARVWHRLLDCGFRVAAAGGTDAMTNFASLRGPVGLNRTYVDLGAAGALPAAEPEARERRWLAGLAAGRSLATNGPLLGMEVEGHGPGATIELSAGAKRLAYRGFLRSIVPVDHLELVLDGEVAASIDLGQDPSTRDFDGTLEIERSGWLVLRAWSERADPRIFDLYPYATTSPIWIEVGGSVTGERCDTGYFLAWIDRVEGAATEHRGYNDDAERTATLREIERARQVYERLRVASREE